MHQADQILRQFVSNEIKSIQGMKYSLTIMSYLEQI